MELREHARTTGTALRGWLVAQFYDSAAVGVLWLVGLLLLHVPWAPLWALVGMLCQMIPYIGTVFGMIGPALVAFATGCLERGFYVLILYAVIVVIDGFLLQPYFLRRKARVPVWASVLVPLVMAFFVPFWGVLLAPPVLAVVFAYKSKRDIQKNAGPDTSA